MLYTINSKFFSIAVVLVVLFGLGYGILAFFLRDQHQSTMLMQEAVTVEREIRRLHDLFYEVRFWESAVLFQKHPEADKKFGAVIERLRKRISKMHDQKPGIAIERKFKPILESLTRYEKNFNQMIQHKTEQRLNRTRMDTAHQSLVSNVLRSNRAHLFRPLLNLNHFLSNYHIDRKKSEYQALILVVDYLESKLLQAQIMDHRMKGYVKNFRGLLASDFQLEQKIRSINERFDVVSAQLMNLMMAISEEAENILRNKFLETNESRMKLNNIFILSTAVSIVILLLILTVIAKKIVYPLRSVADVMKEVKNKNIASRFEYNGNKGDEIVHLGLSFNDMLDTIQKSNEQLINYKNELEKKVDELASRENELKKHREDLEILVQERTNDLTVVNSLLKSSIKEKDVLLKEIHHRVKNNLQIIASLLKIQSKYIDDAQAAELFQDSQDRISSMALIHEQLYQSEDLSSIDFKKYIRELANRIHSSFGPGTGRVMLNTEVGDIELSVDVAMPCGLIINELVSNSLKHAFPSDKSGAIFITCQLVDADTIELVVGDNGIGIPKDIDFAKSRTMGLQLVTDLVEQQLSGKIEVRHNGGTEFRVNFKHPIIK